MYTGCCSKLRKVLSRVFMVKASGSTLLWAISALVLLSVVGTTVALMSPSALQSKLEQEAGMRAYYNANAGLNYILGAQQAAQVNGTSFSNFTSAMGGGSTVAYNIGSDGNFSFQLGNMVTSGTNGTYQVTSLVGAVTNSAGGGAYGYVIYGGGKGSSSSVTYTPVATNSGNKSGSKKLNVASSVNLTSYSKGDTLAEKVTLAEGATVEGSITSTSTTSELNIGRGATVTGNLCSNYNINLLAGSKVTGDIVARGNIAIVSATVTGNVYADGDVSITGSSTINGNVYSQGNVYVEYASIGSKKIKYELNGLTSVTINAWETLYTDLVSKGSVYNYNATVYGNVHYGIGFTNTGNLYGTSDKSPTSPAVGSTCDSYVTMSLPTITASTAFYIPSSESSMRTITTGTWSYTSIITDGGTSLCLDVSGGDIVLLSTGNVSLNGNLYIKTSSVDNCKNKKVFDSIDVSYYAAAAQVFLGTKGTFTLNGGSNWFGAVLANGNVQPGGGSVIVGSLYSISGTINPARNWYSSRYVQSNYFSQ